MPYASTPPPSRGRLGGGWGYLVAISSIKPPFAPHPHPIPPLEGEGADVHAIALDTQATKRAVGRNEIYGNRTQSAHRVAQGILNGSSGTDAHDLVAQRSDCTRYHRLTCFKFISELSRRLRPLAQAKAKMIRVSRHAIE